MKSKDAATPAKAADVQKWWREALGKFVTDFPNIDETPEAYFRLAMAHEFHDKDSDKIAAKHYKTIPEKFPGAPMTQQAIGAANRLESEGKPFSFPGCVGLANNAAFNPAAVAGKATIVYFWGSYAVQDGRLKADAAVLDGLAKKHAGKLEIITVAIDATGPQATQALTAAGMPGTHLVSPNGQMTTAWGIMGQHMFLVDKDGKVVDNNAGPATVGDQVEKLVK
jgi:hypothetical protein